MSDNRLEYLFEQRIRQTLTGQEEKEWMELLLKPENKDLIEQLTERLFNRGTSDPAIPAGTAKGILESILQAEEPEFLSDNKTGIVRNFDSGIRRTLKFAAAAAVLIVVSTGVLHWLNKTDSATKSATAIKEVKIGGPKAILVLADGSKIALDTLNDGSVQTQGNATLTKAGNGQIKYASNSVAAEDQSVTYNMISTPKGGQYQVTLADGSRVWLNAASSIHFPTAFNGAERKVEITGEAYFEIASVAKKPFKVAVTGMEVQVLGTHFNINSYADEKDIRTTLLEGSVKVIGLSDSKILKPGQQAQTDPLTNASIDVLDVNTDEVMAWKNGFFQMSETSIPAVMRQVSRWYDIDIEYPKGVPDGTISGKIPRDMNFSNVMEVLKKSGINLEFRNNKVLIFP